MTYKQAYQEMVRAHELALAVREYGSSPDRDLRPQAIKDLEKILLSHEQIMSVIVDDEAPIRPGTYTF